MLILVLLILAFFVLLSVYLVDSEIEYRKEIKGRSKR